MGRSYSAHDAQVLLASSPSLQTALRSDWWVSFRRSQRAWLAPGQWSLKAGGDKRASFTDLNIRGPFSIETTPAIYLSFFDPAGPANMLDNTTRLREPLLWVAGTGDRSQPGPGYAFARAPSNPLNRYVTVSADHLGTPTASQEAVLAWLRELK